MRRVDCPGSATYVDDHFYEELAAFLSEFAEHLFGPNWREARRKPVPHHDEASHLDPGAGGEGAGEVNPPG